MADLGAYNDLESEFKRLSSLLPTRISTVETHESDAGEFCALWICRGNLLTSMQALTYPADKASTDLRAIETDLFQCKQLVSFICDLFP